MKIAEVKNIDINSEKRELIVTISAKDYMYIEEPKQYGFPSILNSSLLVEKINYVLEFGHIAVSAMKNDKDFTELAEQNRKLRKAIVYSDLAARARQFLSTLDYGQLTDFQAKCVLLLERELKTSNI